MDVYQLAEEINKKVITKLDILINENRWLKDELISAKRAYQHISEASAKMLERLVTLEGRFDANFIPTDSQELKEGIRVIKSSDASYELRLYADRNKFSTTPGKELK